MATFEKVSLVSPAGGAVTFCSTTDDPAIERLLSNGWTEFRRWSVHTNETGDVVRCSSQHPNGRQMPIYDGHGDGQPVATGRFRCEVCGEEYDPR